MGFIKLNLSRNIFNNTSNVLRKSAKISELSETYT